MEFIEGHVGDFAVSAIFIIPYEKHGTGNNLILAIDFTFPSGLHFQISVTFLL